MFIRRSGRQSPRVPVGARALWAARSLAKLPRKGTLSHG